MDDVTDFFQAKQGWSKYKDLILDYYLEPYLAKIARLRKPIAVVDCFAGAGKFEDGEQGSPLIIAKRLAQAKSRGAEVLGVFIEENDVLFGRLEKNAESMQVSALLRHGDFHHFLDEIGALAETHSLFVYLDPIRPTDLFFDDLAAAYDKLRSGQSVETLINFLSTGFVRIPQGMIGRFGEAVLSDRQHPETDRCMHIAGGDYWIEPILDYRLNQGERIEAIAAGYSDRLHRWFQWVLKYPIRERYEDETPKYHLIFGSRHPDAVDLMNRAMVTARRKFVGSRFVEGMLFPNQPQEEVVKEDEIFRLLIATIQEAGQMTWKMLRIRATIKAPCLYTESEMNRAIKSAIQSEKLNSHAKGNKIEDDAMIWI